MAAITSNGAGGGLASATGTWTGGVVPVVGDSVTIPVGDIVVIDGVYTWGDDTTTAITVNGTIQASRTITNSLTCRGELLINGTLDYGTSASPIPANISATIILNDSVTVADGKHGLEVVATAKFFVYGAVTNTVAALTADVLANSQVIVVDNVTGWKVGDEICIATSGSGGSSGVQQEKRPIQSITGNTITLLWGLTYPHGATCPVGNLTKNVTIKSISTTMRSYIILRQTQVTLANTREIQHLAINSLSAGAGNWDRKAAINITGQGAAWHAVVLDTIYTSFGNVTFQGGANYSIDLYSTIGRVTLDDILIYAEYTTQGYGIYIRQGGVSTFNRLSVLGGCNIGVMSAWSQGGVGCIFNDGYVTGGTNCFTNSSAQGFIFNRTIFANSYILCSLGWGATPTFNNCSMGTIVGNHDTRSSFLMGCEPNGLVNPIIKNCTIATTTVTEGNFNMNNLVLANTGLVAKIVNKNSDLTLQEEYTARGYQLRDNVTKYRGGSSMKCTPKQANLPYSTNYSVPCTGGIPTTVIVYIRFDTAYGIATPPVVTLSGLGSTPAVVTTPGTANAWHRILLTATSATSGVLTLNVVGQSASVTSNYWIDGVANAPFVNKVRHYGYIKDETSPSRKINNNVVKTEVNAGLVTGAVIDGVLKTITINTAMTTQDLYDYCQWWYVQTTNFIYDEPLSTTDGVNFSLALGWTIIFNSNLSTSINISGNCKLLSEINLTNINITGNLNINTGLNSALAFNNVIVSGLVYNDDTIHTLTINNTGTSLSTAGDPGTAVGLTNISTVFAFTITGLIAGSIVTVFDNEILDVGNNNTILGTTLNSGTTYTYLHNAVTNTVRVQVIKIGYEEIIQTFVLTNTNQSLPITQKLNTN